MFFPYRGEIVPRVSKPLGGRARPSPQHAGQEAGSLLTAIGTSPGWLLTLQDSGPLHGAFGGERGLGKGPKTVNRPGQRTLSLNRSTFLHAGRARQGRGGLEG